jgi:hypothetical protein
MPLTLLPSRCLANRAGGAATDARLSLEAASPCLSETSVDCASVHGDTPNLDSGSCGTRPGGSWISSRVRRVRAEPERGRRECVGEPADGAILESLAAWVDDWPEELQPSWSDFAKAIIAATVYE